MEGLCCGERDICMHAYVLTHVSHVAIPYMCIHMTVLTHVSHVSTRVTTRVEPIFKRVSLCRVLKACKLGDRQQGEARPEATMTCTTSVAPAQHRTMHA